MKLEQGEMSILLIHPGERLAEDKEENERSAGTTVDDDCGAAMSHEKTAELLTDIVEEMAHVMGMQDWKVNVVYNPDEYSETVAEVICTVHKEADITFYRFRPELVYDDVMHELAHCKVSLMREGYATVIRSQQSAIYQLMQNYEELVVDGLVRMMRDYVPKSYGVEADPGVVESEDEADVLEPDVLSEFLSLVDDENEENDSDE